MGGFRPNARNASGVFQHTILSHSNCCGSISWMEALPSLGASFDVLGLDFAWRGPHLRCNCDPDF